jgi:hypothetical protein
MFKDKIMLVCVISYVMGASVLLAMIVINPCLKPTISDVLIATIGGFLVIKAIPKIAKK